jgi:serine/threonine-protein kinase RsbW
MSDPLAGVTATFRARPEGLVTLHATFDRFFEAADGAGATIGTLDQMAMLTAAAEVAANIVDHACHHLADDAEVSVALARLGDRVEARFEDHGAAYGDTVPDRANPVPHMGLGLDIARASVHALEYEREGQTNRWTLVRRLA